MVTKGGGRAPTQPNEVLQKLGDELEWGAFEQNPGSALTPPVPAPLRDPLASPRISPTLHSPCP